MAAVQGADRGIGRTGTTVQPEPRIRLIFESASSGDTDSSTSDSGHPLFSHHSSDTNSSAADPRFTEVHSSEEDSLANARDDDDDSSSQVTQEPAGDFEGAGPKENALLMRVYGLDVHSDDERDWASMKVDVDGSDEARGRRASEETVRWEDLDEDAKKDVVARAEHETVHHKARVTSEREEIQAEAVAANEADDEGSYSLRPRCASLALFMVRTDRH